MNTVVKDRLAKVTNHVANFAVMCVNFVDATDAVTTAPNQPQELMIGNSTF